MCIGPSVNYVPPEKDQFEEFVKTARKKRRRIGFKRSTEPSGVKRIALEKYPTADEFEAFMDFAREEKA